MTEIDERLNYIRERVDAHAFHNARADLRYLVDLVAGLHQQLAQATALVPEAALLDSLSYCADGIVPVNAEKARTLAARIRDWRGDSDGGEMIGRVTTRKRRET